MPGVELLRVGFERPRIFAFSLCFVILLVYKLMLTVLVVEIAGLHEFFIFFKLLLRLIVYYLHILKVI
jgi:hypothetical protein